MDATLPYDRATQVLAAAAADRIFPGAAAEIGSSAGTAWSTEVGAFAFAAAAPAVTRDTVYDLASLTKPLATTAVALNLFEQQRLTPDERVSHICPSWRGGDRDAVTIADLLEHASGLPARLAGNCPEGRAAFADAISTVPLEYAPRTRALYSDLGFILLGLVAEQAGRDTLAAQTNRVLEQAFSTLPQVPATALLLTHVADTLHSRTAPTTPLREDTGRTGPLVGDVQDTYAAALGGFAGHAGLFGTVGGVAAAARLLLRALRGDGPSTGPFSTRWVRRAVTPSTVPGSSRALGWDTMRPTSSCGTYLSTHAFGHVGFTGTSLWIDPVRDRYFVLLSNRVHGGGSSDDMQRVRRAFHDALADA